MSLRTHLNSSKITSKQCNINGVLTMAAVTKRVEISLPIESFELVREAAERRGLSIRGYISACAYNAALLDKREHNELGASVQTFVIAPESGKVFANAWDQNKPDNEKLRKAKLRASEIREIEPRAEDQF